MSFWDDCLSKDPKPVWIGSDPDLPRHIWHPDGGPKGGPWRELVLRDGEERQELGLNSRTYAAFLCREGERMVLTMHYRLPDLFPIDARPFQTIMQLKQTGPVGGTPVLALRAHQGKYRLLNTLRDRSQRVLWEAPAQRGVWERFIFYIVFSEFDGQVSVNLRGDCSPAFTTNTLWPGGVPSHLRAGIYHDTSIPGTSIHLGETRAISI